MGGVSSVRRCMKYRIKYDILVHWIFVIDLVISLCFNVNVKPLDGVHQFSFLRYIYNVHDLFHGPERMVIIN